MEITIKNGIGIETLYNPRNLDYGSPKKIKIEVDNYNYFYYDNNVGNCKTSSLLSLQGTFKHNKEGTINRIKELFKCTIKLTFSCTFNDLEFVEEMCDYFKPLYIVKVPIGYNDGYQYHCSFLTGENYPNNDVAIRSANEEATLLDLTEYKKVKL